MYLDKQWRRAGMDCEVCFVACSYVGQFPLEACWQVIWGKPSQLSRELNLRDSFGALRPAIPSAKQTAIHGPPSLQSQSPVWRQAVDEVAANACMDFHRQNPWTFGNGMPYRLDPGRAHALSITYLLIPSTLSYVWLSNFCINLPCLSARKPKLLYISS